ncbi:MAG TPA: MBL fold metallo-hydrolase [Candidatus Nitrosocosmicus sp.]|nr:MBL fold metallo-hydrolase [Candidatus Nitrosocosmicus sp.]
MNIVTYPLGQLQANCYFIINDNQCLIIDPGDSADFLLEEISRKNLIVAGILATHGHFDHVMAVGELQMSLNVPLYIHDADQFLLNRLKETSKHFLRFDPNVINPISIQNLTSGTFVIRNFKFVIISTPGHTPGSCCFYFEEEQAVFTGDTLFKDSVGSYNHSYSSKKDLFQSMNTINNLGEGITAYPGHGESFLL